MKTHEFIHEMTTTSGIFGRNKDVQVTFSGEQAYTDGKIINLPMLTTDELDTETVRMMRGYVDHEAGHIRHSDMPLINKKYKKWVDAGHLGLKNLANVCEDVWMEAKVIDDYPGSERNLKATANAVNKRELEFAKENLEHLQKFNTDSALLATALKGRESYASELNAQLQDLLPSNIKEHASKWVEEIHKCKNSSEVMEIAKGIYRLLEQDPELKSSPDDFQPGGEDPTKGDGDEPQENQKTILQPKEGEGEANGMAEALEEALKPGRGNPQGNYKGPYRILTTKHDKVYSSDKPDSRVFKKSDTTQYIKDKSSIQSHVMVMKNSLRRALLSKQRRDWDFGRQIGKLDSKRLVSAYGGSQSVFKARVDREEENTAIQILVDLSGSMSGEPISLARQCAVALGECFEGTSLSYQISGWTTESKEWPEDDSPYHRIEANVIYNFKPFEQSLRASRPYLGSMHQVPMANNADRDAIVWALNSLRKRDEKRKVLVVLSDGYPANATRNVDRFELIRHANEAVKWGTSKGIECVGIGIMSDAVEKIYPDYVVINNIQELSSTAFRKFTTILTRGR
jgi:cobalamin biosynthesis protein CobT